MTIKTTTELIEIDKANGASDSLTTVQREDTAQKARKIVESGTPEHTARAAQSDLHYFRAWYELEMRSVMPEDRPVSVEILIQFIAQHLEGLPLETDNRLVELGVKQKPGTHALSTVKRRVAMLSTWHNQKGCSKDQNPCNHSQVKELLKKAARANARNGVKPNKKKALKQQGIYKLLAVCDESPKGLRDAALIQVGFFSGGRRRSETAAMVVERLEKISNWNTPKYRYNLGISKANQTGESDYKIIAKDAAVALQKWLEVSGITSGAIFRPLTKGGNLASEKPLTPHSVAQIIKQRALEAGLDPSEIGGHSIRSGFVMEASSKKVPMFAAMQATGHKSTQTMKRYYEEDEAEENPAYYLAG